MPLATARLLFIRSFLQKQQKTTGPYLARTYLYYSKTFVGSGGSSCGKERRIFVLPVLLTGEAAAPCWRRILYWSDNTGGLPRTKLDLRAQRRGLRSFAANTHRAI